MTWIHLDNLLTISLSALSKPRFFASNTVAQPFCSISEAAAVCPGDESCEGLLSDLPLAAEGLVRLCLAAREYTKDFFSRARTSASLSRKRRLSTSGGLSETSCLGSIESSELASSSSSDTP